MVETNCIGYIVDQLHGELEKPTADRQMTAGLVTQLTKTMRAMLELSCQTSQEMLKQFVQHHGYHEMANITKQQFIQDNQADGTAALEQLQALVFINTTFYTPAEDNMADLTKDQVNQLQSSGGDKQVRCFAAFEAMQDLCSHSDCPESLIGHIMQAIVDVYSAHPLNFFVLRSLHVFESQLRILPSLPPDLQRLVLKTFEFVATVLSLVPTRELAEMNKFLTKSHISGATVEIIFETVLKLVNFDVRFKSAMRQSGLLSTIIQHIYWFSTSTAPGWIEENFGSISTQPPEITFVQMEQVQLVLDALETLVQGSPENALSIKEFGPPKFFSRLIVNPKTRAGGFRLLQSVVLSDLRFGAAVEMALLMKLARVVPPPEADCTPDILRLPTDVLGCVQKLCHMGALLQHSFGEVDGMCYLVELLEETARCCMLLIDASQSNKEYWLGKFEAVIATIISATHRHIENRDALLDAGFCDKLVTILLQTGLIEQATLKRVLSSLVDVATGRSLHSDVPDLLTGDLAVFELPVVMPQMTVVMFKLEPELSPEDWSYVLSLVHTMACRYQINCEGLCSSGLISHILLNHASTLTDTADPNHQTMLSLLCQLGAFRLLPGEMRQLLRLTRQPATVVPANIRNGNGRRSPPAIKTSSSLSSLQLADEASAVSAPLVSALNKMAQMQSVPACEINLRGHSHAGLAISALSALPNLLLTDYSFSIWLSCDDYGAYLPLYTLTSPNGNMASACIREGKLQFSSSMQSQQHLSASVPFDFEPSRWYHIVVVVKKNLFLSASSVSAYINGFKHFSEKHESPSLDGSTSLFIGSNGETCPGCALSWRVGPVQVISRSLNADSVVQLYLKGPAYCATVSSQNSRSDTFLKSPAGSTITPELLSSISLQALRSIDAGYTSKETKNPPQLVSSQLDMVLSFHPQTVRVHMGIDHLAATRSKIPATEQSLMVLPNSALIGEFAQNSDLSTITTATAAWCVGDVAVLQPVPMAIAVRSVGGVNLCLSLATLANTSSLLAESIQFLGSVLNGNLKNLHEMARVHGYRVLNLVLSMKHALVTFDVLDAVCEIVTASSPQHASRGDFPSAEPRGQDQEGSSANCSAPLLVNSLALSYIMLDFTLWSRSSRAAAQELFDRIKLMIIDSQVCDFNLHMLRRSRLVPQVIDFIRRLCVFHENDQHKQDLVKVIGSAVGVVSLMLTTSVDKGELLTVAGFLLYTVHQARVGGISRANAGPKRHSRTSSIPRFPFSSPPTKGSCIRSGHVRKLNVQSQALDKQRLIEARHEILSTLIAIARKISKAMSVNPKLSSKAKKNMMEAICSVISPEFLLQMLEGLVCTVTAELLVRLMTQLMLLSPEWLQRFRTGRFFRDFHNIIVTHHFCSGDIYGVLLHLMAGISPIEEQYSIGKPLVPTIGKVYCPELIPLLLDMVQRCSTRALGTIPDEINSSGVLPKSKSSNRLSDNADGALERSFAFHPSSSKATELQLPLMEARTSYEGHIEFANWALLNLSAWMDSSSQLRAEFRTNLLINHMSQLLFAFASEIPRDAQADGQDRGVDSFELRTIELMKQGGIADHFTTTTARQVLEMIHNIAMTSILEQSNWSKQLDQLLLSPPPATPSHHISFHTKFFCRLLFHVTEPEELPPQTPGSQASVEQNLMALAIQLAHMNHLGQVPLSEHVLMFLLALLNKFRPGSTCMTKAVGAAWRCALAILSDSDETSSFVDTLTQLDKFRDLIYDSQYFEDKKHVVAMCHLVGEKLMHDDKDLRITACTAFASLMSCKVVRENVLSWQDPESGEIHDLYTNGFELLLSDTNAFSSWLFDSYERVCRVLSQSAEVSWHHLNATRAHNRGEARRRIQQQRQDIQAAFTEKEMEHAISVKGREAGRREWAEILVETHENEWRRRQQDRLNAEALAAARIGVVLEEIFRERGVWGAESEEEGVRWKLDSVEGPGRTRVRLERCGTAGAAQLLERKDQSSPLYNMNAADGGECSESDVDVDASPQSEITSESLDEPLGAAAPAECENGEDNDLTHDALDPNEGEETVLSELLGHDTIDHRYECERVAGINCTEALFLLCARGAYLVDTGRHTAANGPSTREFEDELVTPSSTSSSISNCVQQAARGIADPRDAVVPYDVWEWRYPKIQQVHKRFYNLQPVALELFDMDGTNQLITFASVSIRDRVYTRLRGLVTWPDTSQTMHSTTECGLALLQDARTTWCERLSLAWRERRLSNFEYIMLLNTLAGRTYNDLTQYPIFPWILAEYSTPELDLQNPSSFRDLSRPMGAQGEARAKMFQQRYDDWFDPEVPKFHYGTHYSSPGIVLSYLLRLSPFTEQYLQLQGGRFDIPDRLFYSIEDSWGTASRDSMADVKELTPEFFYLPEMFVNADCLNMGEKNSTGEEISHVELPAWANGDPWEFVRMHREALECEYVSAHLHEWIDLIFGYKQQGQAAIDAQNVFFYLTYTDAVAIDKISDTIRRNATISQINNFGQTPQQLFSAPHLKRSPGPSVRPGLGGMLSAHNVPRLHGNRLLQCSGPVGFMDYGGEKRDKLCTLGINCRLLFPEHYAQYGDPAGSLRIFHIQGQLAAVHEGLHDGGVVAAGVAAGGWNANFAIVVTGGMDGLVGVWRIPKPVPIAKAQLMRQLDGHGCAITFVAASHMYGLAVSGDCQGGSIVWDLNRLLFVRQLTKHKHSVVAIIIGDKNGTIATCCSAEVRVHSVNGALLQMVQTEPDDPITALALMSRSYGGNMVFTGHQQGRISCWGDRDSLARRNKLASQGVHLDDAEQSPPEPVEKVIENGTDHDDTSFLTGKPRGKKPYQVPTEPTPECRKLGLCLTLEGHHHEISWIHVCTDHTKVLSSDLKGNILQWSLEDQAARS